MKKISSKIIISVLLAIFLWLGVGFGVQNILAQDNVDYSLTTSSVITPASCSASGLQGVALQNCINSINDVPSGIADCDVFSSNANARADCIKRVKAIMPGLNAAAAAARTAAANEPSFWESLTGSITSLITGPIAKIVMGVQGVIFQFILIPLMSVVFRIFAALLDMSLNFTLSTQIFSASSSGVAIVWALIRDMCNITFIFILLWTSIQTILGTASGKTKKMIADVIIAALLINFSLFITRILIDIGNILGVALYNQIQSTAGPGGASLGTILMQNMGLGHMATEAGAGVTSVFSVAYGVVSFLQFALLFIAVIVFAYATLLMVTRIVVLIFLAAMSPIGFMGDVLPKLAEYSKMWRETLYGQIMIAPVFLLFIYLIVKVNATVVKVIDPTYNPAASAGVSMGPSAAMAAEAINTATSAADNPAQYVMYFRYIMIIMLLIIAVKTTKKMTGAVGSAIEGIAKAAVGIAIGAVTGGVALLGRQVIGRTAGGIASSEKLTEWSKGKGAGGFAARMALRGADKTSKSTFDARNTGGFKSITGAIGEHTGMKVDYGKSAEGGYQGMAKRAAEKSEETAKLIAKGRVGEIKGERVTKIMDEAAENRSEAARLRNLTSRTSTEEAELARLEGEDKKHKVRFAGMEQADDKIAFAKKALEKEAVAERLKAYSKTVEESGLNILYRNKGDVASAAKKVREASNDKDVKALMKEAMKKLEDEAKQPAAPAPAPTAPSGGGPTPAP